MKKKLISSGIILFVLSYVLVAGFLILKTSLTDGYSNAQLIANFLVPITPASSVGIAHLADATSAVEQPNFQQQLSIGSYADIAPIIASDTADVATTTPDNATSTTTTTTTTDTDNNLASTDTTTSSQNTSTAEQNLEILAATLIHLEMSSTTALQ